MNTITDSKNKSYLLDRADRFENTNNSDSEEIFYDADGSEEEIFYGSDEEIFYDSRDFFDQVETKIGEKDKTSSHSSSNKVATDSSSLQPSPTDTKLSQKRKFYSSSPQALEAGNTKKKVKFGDTSSLGTTNNPQPTFSSRKTVPSSGFFASKNLTSFASASANNATSFSSLLSEKRKHDITLEEDKATDVLLPKASICPPQKKVKVTEEETIYQVDGILFMSEPNGDMNEYSEGKLRLIKKENQCHLVMRDNAEFRTVLNVKLFPGMKVYAKPINFLRFGVLETNTNTNGEVETKMVDYILSARDNIKSRQMSYKINVNIPPPATTVDNIA